MAIRHLENVNMHALMQYAVHGIRHLETTVVRVTLPTKVHGGIRHLEIFHLMDAVLNRVHGGIRHLENMKN